jgi:hypothetical protein
MFAGYAIMFDAKGWDGAAIAELWGREAWEVEAVLRPVPPRRFHTHDEGRGWFAAPAEYLAEVQRFVAFWLGGAYRNAAQYAVREGWPELVPQLEALARHHEEQYERLRDRDLRVARLSPERRYVAGGCAILDARTTLGIEVRQATFLDMWNDECEDDAEDDDDEDDTP